MNCAATHERLGLPTLIVRAGNPVNMLVADALDMSLLSFSRWMMLPSLGEPAQGALGWLLWGTGCQESHCCLRGSLLTIHDGPAAPCSVQWAAPWPRARCT